MERIGKIINIQAHNAPVERIRYMPYQLKKAVAYFTEIGRVLVGGDTDASFKVTKGNEGLFLDLIRYVHADPECSLDTSKAIGLIGGTGGGKSLAFRLMQEYIKIDDVKYIRNGKQVTFRFDIYSARSIMASYQQHGFEGIEKVILQNNICIDDLGAEISEVSHFGNKINIIEHVIEERYLRDKITHFSSNLSESDIKAKYGDRAYSRLIGATNIIQVISHDWRIGKRSAK